jgi:hypothetical protein
MTFTRSSSVKIEPRSLSACGISASEILVPFVVERLGVLVDLAEPDCFAPSRQPESCIVESEQTILEVCTESFSKMDILKAANKVVECCCQAYNPNSKPGCFCHSEILRGEWQEYFRVGGDLENLKGPYERDSIQNTSWKAPLILK